MKFTALVNGMMLAVLSPAVSAQTTWYVDDDATPPGSGTPGDPYASIQYAVDQPTTLDGDTVLVLPGTYAGKVLLRGKTLDLRSRDGAGVTTIVGTGPSDSVVVFSGPEGPGARLAGFTITGGDGHYDGSFFDRGGGIYSASPSARVEDCVITENGGGNVEGGGVFGVAFLARCTVVDNQAECGGGLARVGDVSDCTVAENVAFCSAGGILGVRRLIDSVVRDNASLDCEAGGLLLDDSALIQGCSFERNDATFTDHEGGAILVTSGHAIVDATRFLANEAVRGGAVHVRGGAAATLGDCTFEQNLVIVRNLTGHSNGGAVYAEPAASVVVRRGVFAANRAELGIGPGGGRGSATFGPMLLLNCTLVENVAEVSGTVAGPAELRNCIVWDDVPDTLTEGATATYSDVEGGAPGVGNIDADPRFYDPVGRDYHLRAGSPCIDAGDPADVPDADGSRTDMGAFPFDAGYCPAPKAYCTAKVNSQGCVPAIDSTGSPTLTGADDFFVTATEIINRQPGILIWSLNPNEVAFQGGTLCLAASIVRTPVQSSGGNPPPADCSGSFSFHFSQAYLGSRAVAAFTALHAQYWYRDPGSPFPIGLTDALRFLVCP